LDVKITFAVIGWQKMISIRCRDCNKELVGHPTKTVSCGCPNMATIRGDKISALDLSRIVMLNSLKETSRSNVLTSQDIAWQEARRQRKVRRLDFEVR
jgi:phage FluMu protein Com